MIEVVKRPFFYSTSMVREMPYAAVSAGGAGESEHFTLVAVKAVPSDQNWGHSNMNIEEQKSSNTEKSLECRELGGARFHPSPPRLLLPAGCPASLCFPRIINLSCRPCPFYLFPQLQSLARSPHTTRWENTVEESNAPESSCQVLLYFR